MWWDGYMGGHRDWGFPGGGLGLILLVVVLDLVLKGVALWKSARNGQSTWFIFILIVNSLGILPVIYLLTNKEVVPSKKVKK